MAGSRFSSALSLLSLGASALALPLTSENTANILSSRSTATDSICSAKSTCIPFTINLTWGTANPTGGQARNVILSNGTFPGPPLRMKVGECVDFLVINNLPAETGVHFHGINQAGTPWADGVPGLSQYAIKSGDQYMARWTADEQGAYFYHGHYKGQMMDGLYGAIMIEPSDTEPTPYSLISASDVDLLANANAKSEPIFASDWSQYTFDEFMSIEQAANVDIACADAIILNGMGSEYCLTTEQIIAYQAPQIPALLNTSTTTTGLTAKACLPPGTVAVQGPYPHNLSALPANVYSVCNPSSGSNYTFKVDPADKYASITLINPGGFSLLKASIDNHKMWVYYLNGQYVQPQLVDQVPIGNGDRVSFFIKLDQTPGDYPIRVSNNGLNQIISGFGVLSYKGSSGLSPTDVPSMLYNGVNTTAIVAFTPLLSTPFPAVPVPTTADKTIRFNIQKLPDADSSWQWTLQGFSAYSMSNDDQAPLLYKSPSQIPESNITYKQNLNEWVDLIIETEGPLAQPHPMHKHGNKFFVLGSGSYAWNWSSVAAAQAAGAVKLNTQNAPYVDGYTTIPGEGMATWTVLRYQASQAGVWFFHCHIQTHLSGGMAVALLDGVDQWPVVPSDAGKACQGDGRTASNWTGSCACPASCAANGNGSSNSTGGWSAGGVWSGSGSTVTSGSGQGGVTDSKTGDENDGVVAQQGTNSNGTATTSSMTATYTGAATRSGTTLTFVSVLVAAMMMML